IELLLALPDIGFEAIAIVDLRKSAYIVQHRTRIDILFEAVLSHPAGDLPRDRRPAQKFGISKTVFIPVRCVKGERVQNIKNIVRAVRFEKMLQYESIVERTRARRGEIEDFLAGFAFHVSVEIVEVERHGVRGAENDPVEFLSFCRRDLVERIALSRSIHELLGGVIDERIDREADRKEEKCGFAEALHGLCRSQNCM